MKKSRFIVNIVIILMLSTLTMLAVSNTKALNVQAAKFTDGAAKKITAAGGPIEVR